MLCTGRNITERYITFVWGCSLTAIQWTKKLSYQLEYVHDVHTLRWRHNERDGVLNNRRLHCLLNLSFNSKLKNHYNDVIMSVIASQITRPTIVYSTVHSGTDQSKHQNSASLAFVRGIHRWPLYTRFRPHSVVFHFDQGPSLLTWFHFKPSMIK